MSRQLQQLLFIVIALLAISNHCTAATSGDDDDDEGFGWDDTNYSITNGATFVVTSPGLNVRKCPSSKSSKCTVIGGMKRGDWGRLTGQSKMVKVGFFKKTTQQWLEISYRSPIAEGGQWHEEAWVARTASKTGEKLLLIEEEADGFDFTTCVVQADALSVRAGPGVSAGKIGNLNQGESFAVIYASPKVNNDDGLTWWAMAYQKCAAASADGACETTTGFVADQATSGSTKPLFLRRGEPGFPTDTPQQFFDVDYSVISKMH